MSKRQKTEDSGGRAATEDVEPHKTNSDHNTPRWEWRVEYLDGKQFDPKQMVPPDHRCYRLLIYNCYGQDVFHWHVYDVVAEVLLQHEGVHIDTFCCNGKLTHWKDSYSTTALAHEAFEDWAFEVVGVLRCNTLTVYARSKITIKFASAFRLSSDGHRPVAMRDDLFEELTHFLHPDIRGHNRATKAALGWRKRVSFYVHEHNASDTTEPLFSRHTAQFNTSGVGNVAFNNNAMEWACHEPLQPFVLRESWQVQLHTFTTFFSVEEWRTIISAVVDEFFSKPVSLCSLAGRFPKETKQMMLRLALDTLCVGDESLTPMQLSDICDTVNAPRYTL